jgi:hypothetical protein
MNTTDTDGGVGIEIQVLLRVFPTVSIRNTESPRRRAPLRPLSGKPLRSRAVDDVKPSGCGTWAGAQCDGEHSVMRNQHE